MNERSDIDRVLRHWFEDGPSTMPDRIVDVVAHRISIRAQRRSWRLLGRSSMSPMLKWGSAAAAVVVLAVIGYNLLPGRSGPGTPTTAPTPTQIPTATPIPSAPPDITDGIVAAGTYRLRPFASATMTIDATVPDGGWVGGPPAAIGGPVGESNGPNGVAVAFFNAQTINSDPCHWDKDGSGSAPQVGDIEVGPTVDDLSAALAGSSAYESTTPVAATLGGYSGKRLELQLVPDPSGCDSFDGAADQYFVFGGREGGQFAQGGANTWQVTVVDVEGKRLIGVLISYAETSREDLTAAQAILDSVVITP
jgi:hypothetical protein